jgi:hypothetical protein
LKRDRDKKPIEEGENNMDQREMMKRRSRRAKENRDKRFGGKAKYSVLNLDAMCRDFGWDEVPWYKVTAGAAKNEIDILMFLVTQKWYGSLRAYDGTPTELEVGAWDYKLEIPVHSRWGGDNSSPLFCLNEGIGKKCPICEDRQAEWDKGKGKSDKEILKALNASWRCFYNIYDYTQGLYLPWEAAYKSFEEMLQDEIDIQEKEQGIELYPWDLEDGRTIEFKGRVKQIGETEYNEPQIPSFFERDPYDQSIFEKVISFDKYLKIPSYDEVCRIYYGVGDDDVKVRDPEPEPDPPQERGRRRSRPSEETQTEEAPPPSRRRESRQRTENTNTQNDTRCPFGHIFGVDCNKKDECSSDCPESDFDACISEQDRLLKDERPSESPSGADTTSSRTRQRRDESQGEESAVRRRRRN